MKYNRGDIVMISRNPRDPGESPNMNHEMRTFKGKKVTVARHRGGDLYYIEEDGGHWTWAGRWFEKPVDQLVEISGSEIKMYRKSKKSCVMEKGVAIRDLLEKLGGFTKTKKNLLKTPLLFSGIKHYSKAVDGTELYIHELLPQKLCLNMSTRGKGKKVVRLAFPYILFFFCFQNACLISKGPKGPRCFYRTSAFRSLGDELFHSNLPKVKALDDSCSIECGLSFSGSPAEQINAFLELFWNQQFCGKKLQGSAAELKSETKVNLSDPLKWQVKSIENPLHVLKLPWRTSGLTAEAIIKNLLEGEYIKPKADNAVELISLLKTVGGHK